MALKPPPVVIVDLQHDRIADTTGRIRPGDIGVTHSVFRQKPEEVPPADLVAWSDYLAKWNVPKPVRIKLSAERNGHMVFMRMEAREPDARQYPRNNRQHPLEDVDLAIEIMVPTPRPDESSARWVRALLRWLVCHELDEYTSVGGERIFDPHRHGRSPTPENS